MIANSTDELQINEHKPVLTLRLRREFLVRLVQCGEPILVEPPGCQYLILEEDGTLTPFNPDEFLRFTQSDEIWKEAV